MQIIIFAERSQAGLGVHRQRSMRSYKGNQEMEMSLQRGLVGGQRRFRPLAVILLARRIRLISATAFTHLLLISIFSDHMLCPLLQISFPDMQYDIESNMKGNTFYDGLIMDNGAVQFYMYN